MKKFELYFIRSLLILVLVVLAASPFVAIIHLLHGVTSSTVDAGHLLSLGYLFLIALGLFLISPAYSHNKPRPQRTRPHL